MEKYIIEYTDYNEILGLLGHEITHSKLENVSTIIVDLTEEEYEALIGAGIKIFKNLPGKLLFTPQNVPFRGYPGLTAPDQGVPVNDFLNLRNAHLAGFNGAGTKVAILDTGANISTLQAVPTLIRQDYTGLGPDDLYNHGGKACNIIGQVFSLFNLSISVTYGMAYGCQLYSMNVLDGGTAAVIAAIDYCISHGIDVINISLEMGSGLDTAITAAIDAGIIVVCASGNSTGSPVAHPANVPGVIAVNGVAYDNASVIFGSYITTDGHVQVTTTFYDGGHAESFVGGTSQAAFMISGLMAIYKQKYPSLDTPKAINLLRKKSLEMTGYTYSISSSTKDKLLDYQTGGGFIGPIN